MANEQPDKEIEKKEESTTPSEPVMRLNKYLAHARVASRRKSAEFVKAGQVKVNGEIEINPAYQVQEGDVIHWKDQKLEIEDEKFYLLLNKPKNTITTKDDDQDRKTVMDLLPESLRKKVHPVGRLDRNTTGLLLLTNDGELTHRLTHPSHEVSKVYLATLDREISEEDLDKIRKGLTLSDGPVHVDGVNYMTRSSKKEVGIELHLGRNRIVRRIFEHLGYVVEKLDRLQIAGLTKKDLSRGRFRNLTEREIIMLKHFK